MLLLFRDRARVLARTACELHRASGGGVVVGGAFQVAGSLRLAVFARNGPAHRARSPCSKRRVCSGRDCVVRLGAIEHRSRAAELLTVRGEIDAPHGRFTVGVLIFQDLLVVPLVLVIPRCLLGRAEGLRSCEGGEALLKAVLAIAITIIGDQLRERAWGRAWRHGRSSAGGRQVAGERMQLGDASCQRDQHARDHRETPSSI